MVRAIAAALDDFERDPRVARVVIASAGGRAFCSGGDIRMFYELGRAGDHAAQLDFWREEYQLNRRIARYSKPCVALVDGIVMGGGVGLFAHASHRVVSERCLFAMPEVGIGFFPDVGADLCARAPAAPHRRAARRDRPARSTPATSSSSQSRKPSSPSSELAGADGRARARPGRSTPILDRFAAPPPPGKLAAEGAAIQSLVRPARPAGGPGGAGESGARAPNSPRRR